MAIPIPDFLSPYTSRKSSSSSYSSLKNLMSSYAPKKSSSEKKSSSSPYKSSGAGVTSYAAETKPGSYVPLTTPPTGPVGGGR